MDYEYITTALRILLSGHGVTVARVTASCCRDDACVPVKLRDGPTRYDAVGGNSAHGDRREHRLQHKTEGDGGRDTDGIG